MFKNMGGNIPGGNFLGGNSPGGNFPGGSLMGGNFPGRSFPDTLKNNQAVVVPFPNLLYFVLLSKNCINSIVRSLLQEP